jgi:hypothetical protein
MGALKNIILLSGFVTRGYLNFPGVLRSDKQRGIMTLDLLEFRKDMPFIVARSDRLNEQVILRLLGKLERDKSQRRRLAQ